MVLITALAWASGLWLGSDSWLVAYIKRLLSSTELLPSILYGAAALKVSVIAWLIWCTIAISFLLAVTTNFGRADRVILIVDDLDRCPEDEIVDLIDGIKLMIDDKDVGEVVQAFVLADDTVLETAIQHRFKALTKGLDSSESANVHWRSVVREHMEKVFLCHVSLPELEASDVKSLVETFGKEFDPPESEEYPGSTGEKVVEGGPNGDQADGPASSDTKPGDDPPSEEGTDDEKGATPPSRRDPVLPGPELDATAILSEVELSAIQNALEEQFGETLAAAALTPRTVRSFLFKYQLARMLLQSNGEVFEVQNLARSLAMAVSSAKSDDGAANGSGDSNDPIEAVVRLVA